MVTDGADSESGVYYGWWIVAGLFVILSISSGFGFYNMSVYMNVLSQTQGFAVSDVSFAVTLFFLVGGVGGMWVARLIELTDVRWVMFAGAAISAVALGCVGMSESLGQTYLAFMVFGFGNAGVSIVVSTSLVTRWFPGKNRSIALSIASTGLSTGGILITPLSARLLNEYSMAEMMPWFGGVFFLVMVPIILWIIQARPPALTSLQSETAQSQAWDYRQAIRTRFFVFITLGFVFCMGAQVGGIAHLYNFVERTFDYQLAVRCVQTLTICSILGRFVGGWLVTFLAIRAYTLVNLLGQCCGLLLLANAQTPLMAIAGAALFGATVGNLLMLHPLWLADSFSGNEFGKVFSLSNACSVVGVAAGPFLLGVAYDNFDYQTAYVCAAVVSVLAFVFLLNAGARAKANTRKPRISGVVGK